MFDEKKSKKTKYVLLTILLFSVIVLSPIYAAKGNVKGFFNNTINMEGPKVEDDGVNVYIQESVRNKLGPSAVVSAFKLDLQNAKVYDYVTFGHYEQDNNLQNGKEPIEWQVVFKTADGKALLASRYILDCRKYNTYPAPITWERSTLREWLNTYFYNEAFSPLEKHAVLEVTNTNDKNCFCLTDCGNPTVDKVFCLSLDEAIMFYQSEATYMEKVANSLNPNTLRQCKPTPYAIKQGVRCNGKTKESKGYANYWLRTLGKMGEREWFNGITATYFACLVQEPGFVQPMGTGMNSTDDGVRPCIWVDSMR